MVVTAFLIVSIALAEESPDTPAAAAPLPDFSGELKTTLIDRSGHSSTATFNIYRTGMSIRYEQRDVDPPEVMIKDFSRLKEFRIFPNDQIYFETTMPLRLYNKAQREGLIPMEHRPELITKRVFLGKGVIDGHPIEMILLIRSIKDRDDLAPDYTFIWEALDLQRQAIRVVYYRANLTLHIMNLQNVLIAPIDPNLTKPPAEFISMSPF